MPYRVEYRREIINFVSDLEQGDAVSNALYALLEQKGIWERNPIQAAAQYFGIVPGTIYNWFKLYAEREDLAPKPHPSTPKKIPPDALRAYYAEHPDAFHYEAAQVFNCSVRAIGRALKRLKITRKKKVINYREASPEKEAAYLTAIAPIDESRRVYVDESGINRFYYREWVWAPRGKKIVEKVPGQKYGRVNALAAYHENEGLAPFFTKERVNASVFEHWFSTLLGPHLQPGDVVIMDNARFHRPKPLKELAAALGVTIIFLPPYCPKHNPIENFWANMKRWLRNHMRDYSFASIQEALAYYFANQKNLPLNVP